MSRSNRDRYHRPHKMAISRSNRDRFHRPYKEYRQRDLQLVCHAGPPPGAKSLALLADSIHGILLSTGAARFAILRPGRAP